MQSADMKRRLSVAGLTALMVVAAACFDGQSTAPSSLPSGAPPTSSTAQLPTTTTAPRPPSTTTSLPDAGTVPPTPIFGLFDDRASFPSSADLESAVSSLRLEYPEVADVPIAVPTSAPSDSTVRFIGTVSWDHVPSVLTVISLNGSVLLSVGALPGDFVTCKEPGIDWSPRPWRKDSNGCVTNEGATGEWSENGVSWRFEANPTDVDASLLIVEALRLL